MPYSAEARAWLKDNIEGRRIKCQLLRRDQYQRIVALPLLPRRGRGWGWWTPRTGTTRNLPLEMVRAGWGSVYTQGGAVYGDWEKEVYLAAEAEAQCVFLLFFPFLCLASSLLGLHLLTGPESGLRGEAYGKVAQTSSRLQNIRSDCVGKGRG
jgi:hypothetical protein